MMRETRQLSSLAQYLISTILVSITAQAYLTFFGGRTFEVQLFGKFWDLPSLVLPVVFYFWLITWPLEQRYRKKDTPSVPGGLLLSYVVFGAALLWGVYLGSRQGYLAFLAYSEMFFWVMVLGPMGWSAGMSREEYARVERLVTLPIVALALLVIPALLYARIMGEAFLYQARIDHNVGFTLIFCMIVYFVRVYVQGSHRPLDRWALFILTAALLLVFAKPLVFTVTAGVGAVFVIALQGSSRDFIKRLSTTILALIWLFVLFSSLESLVPSALGDFYRRQWRYKYLHLGRDISGGRFKLWTESYDMIRENPIRGHGIGVPVEVPGLVGEFRTAHNLYIHLFLALGIPGGLVALNSLAQYFRVVATRLRTAAHLDGARLSLFGFVVAMMAYNLTGIFSIAPGAYILFGLSIGILLRFVLEEKADTGLRDDAYVIQSRAGQYTA